MMQVQNRRAAFPVPFLQPAARRWRAMLALVAVCCLATRAAADDATPFNPSLPAKSRCQVAIAQLHPTQFAVGYREVEERGRNIAQKSPHKLKAYIEEHLPLVVVGPGGAPYLVDGHHLCLALCKFHVADRVEARIEANWRDLSPTEFWKKMKEHDWVYLYDCQGRGPLDPEELPKQVTELADDPYRALAWEVRKRGGYAKNSATFSEFRWANYFRTRIPLGSGESGFEQAVEAALKISHAPEAQALPGFSPDAR